ncbi:MAG: UrcA family protein [Proteobacteria bacterium]|nr:UrcA family protein [Pseudomonadota bacterium]
MPNLSPRKLLKSFLLGGAASLTLAAIPAFAQGDERNETAVLNQEEVQVQAPRMHIDRGPLNGPVEKVSASIAVHYADLDLRTRTGARELRVRVRDAAQEVCAQLAGAYRFYDAPGTSCYKTALNNAMVRADEVIDGARQYHHDYYASNDE